jgi:histidine ammonia-lyase
MEIILDPGHATLAQLEIIYRQDASFELTPESFDVIRRSEARLVEKLASRETIYGVNTGFGKLASVRIDDENLVSLQRNLVRSHCAGFGDPLPLNIVRLTMALKCLSLGRGASGVRVAVIELLQDMVKADIFPLIPAQGSVGASGDLAPLAHMAAAMIGEGEVFYRGEKCLASDALEKAGLVPIVLQAKEGLALLNGTQVSTALCFQSMRRWDQVRRFMMRFISYVVTAGKSTVREGCANYLTALKFVRATKLVMSEFKIHTVYVVHHR